MEKLHDSPLLFDEASHTYTIDGGEIPSVTKILKGLVPSRVGGIDYLIDTTTGFAIPKWKMDNAADFGTAIHHAAAMLFSGEYIDYDALHVDLEPAIDALKETIIEYKIVPLVIEQPMAAQINGHWFAGTPDLICTVLGVPYLIDLKTGIKGMAGPQTAAYDYLYRCNYYKRGNQSKRMRRAILHLNADKNKWSLKALLSKSDFKFFRHSLYAHNLKGEIS